MAKIALLIGVSEYEPGLNPLPATIKDVEAMQRVLQNPEIGGFDVECLLNPDTVQMQTAIENLFLGSQRDDIVLLYFSGHGIKHDNGKLYFATKSTRKHEQGELSRASTVSADFVHDIINDNRSRSRRQVIILDCCFSGAFSPGTKGEDDISLNFEKVQLGGEGRAVLTSSTSTQYSFESVYTPYLVQGIETGEADENNDGFISVNELHQYVQRKVQEGKHEMKPQIQAVIKEGFNIVLTKAPIHNREDIYKVIVKSWIADDGKISKTARVALMEQQNRLEIKPDKANAIEEEVLKPHKDYLRRLDLYKTQFLRITQENNPTSEINHDELKRLQQELRLKNEDVDKIHGENRPPDPPTIILPSRTKINFLQFVVVCIIGVVIGRVSVDGSITQTCANKEQYILGDNISLGEELLLKQVTHSDKGAGVKAFAKGDCLNAIKKFQAYRAANLNDPEALIYLNNAKAHQQGSRIKIAVGVPIGTRQDIAEEMLRGVAQAQYEVNNQGGINGKLLEVAIANDNNDPNNETIQATQIAEKLVKDKTILAVVGHNSSDASIAAAPTYQNNGLVMMTPTSFSQQLTWFGTYILRTAPNIIKIAEELAIYAQGANKTNILICADDQAIDTKFKAVFETAMKKVDRKINSINCNLSASNFDPNEVISKAISNGADTLLLAIYIDKKEKSLEIARANKGRLTLLSSSTLARNETLQKGQADVNGMIVAVPWHPTAFTKNPIAFTKNPFALKAEKLWNGRVNWRTATSYDATLAIITGLQNSNTREELQKTLHSDGFSFDGATGKIQFSQSGDRINNSIFLIKVQQKPGTDKYEFVPIP